MDPVTIISGALIAGAGALAKGMLSQAGKDAFTGLKDRVRKIFSEKDKPEGTMALEKIEEKPEQWKPILAEALSETDACDDEQVLLLAKDLIEAMKQEGSGNIGVGKWVNRAESQKGFVQAENITNLTQNFGKKPHSD